MEFNSRTEKNETDNVDNDNNVNSLQASKVSKKQRQASKLHNLGTRIPSETSRRFHRFGFDKHGKINGVLGVTRRLACGIIRRRNLLHTFNPIN